MFPPGTFYTAAGDVATRIRAVRRTPVLLPLIFNMDKGPLPATEGKVLKTGEQEIILLPVLGYPIWVTVTEEGTALSSTVTV